MCSDEWISGSRRLFATLRKYQPRGAKLDNKTPTLSLFFEDACLRSALGSVLAALLSGLLLMLCWAPSAAVAQSSAEGDVLAVAPVVGDSVEVLLKGSNTLLTGVLRRQDEKRVQLTVDGGGTMSIDKRRVESMQLAGTRRAARVSAPWRPDANRSRLLFGPTARNYEAGQVYLAGYQLFFPYAGVGIGNRLGLRGGISFIPFTAQFAYAGTKVGLVQDGSMKIAVGGFGALTTNVYTVEDGDDEYGGAAYGLVTFEGGERNPSDKALTLGGGVLTSGVFETQGFAMAGGEYRFHPHFKLLSENYVLAGDGISVVGSLGLRYLSGRTSLGGGVFVSDLLIDAGLPVLPMFTISYDVGSF